MSAVTAAAGKAYAQWIMAIRRNERAGGKSSCLYEQSAYFDARRAAEEHIVRVNNESLNDATDEQLAEIGMDRDADHWDTQRLKRDQRLFADELIKSEAVEYLIAQALNKEN